MLEIIQEENELADTDVIEHPAHYCAGRKYEPKDVIYDWNLNFYLGSAVKYIARCGRKPGCSEVEDLLKAKQYIEYQIQKITEKEGENGGW